MAQNYGYETLMTELPTYMKQVLRFSIRQVSFHLCSLANMIDVNVVASCGVTIYHMHSLSLLQNGILSALPYLAMWIFSNIISFVADYMIESGRFTHTITRKIINRYCYLFVRKYFNMRERERELS